MLIVVAGPSSHGKTELAKSKYVSSYPWIWNVSTIIQKFDMRPDIFGAKEALSVTELGSPLNNLLAIGIVFVDDFEKKSYEGGAKRASNSIR